MYLMYVFLQTLVDNLGRFTQNSLLQHQKATKTAGNGTRIKPPPPKRPKCNSYHPVMIPDNSTQQDETVYTWNKVAM